MKRGHTRERIILSAIALFGEYSFELVTLSQIAEDVGISSGSIYSHFETKEEILDTIIAYIYENLAPHEPTVEEIRKCLEKQTPREILLHYLHCSAEEDKKKKLPLYRLMYMQLFQSKNVRLAAERLLLDWPIRMTTHILDCLMTEGAIPKGDSKILAQLWMRTNLLLSIFILHDSHAFVGLYHSMTDFFVDLVVGGVEAIPSAHIVLTDHGWNEFNEPDTLKDKIRHNACLLFSEQGYAKTTMRQIAKASGIQVAGIYSRFSSKSEIFNHVVAHIRVAIQKKFRFTPEYVQRFSHSGDPEDLIRDLADFFPPLQGWDRVAYQLIFREQFLSTEVRDVYMHYVSIDRDLLRDALEKLVAEGKLVPCDCESIATAFIFNMCSLSVEAILREGDNNGERDRVSLCALLVSVITGGYPRRI